MTTACTSPIYPGTPIGTPVTFGTGVAVRTVSGVTGLTLLAAATTNGQNIDCVQIVGQGTTTANVVRLWLYTGTGNALLVNEVQISAVTASLTAAQTIYAPLFGARGTPFYLAPGQSLYISTNNTENYNAVAFGGSY